MHSLTVLFCFILFTIALGNIVKSPNQRDVIDIISDSIFTVPREEVTFRLWTRENRDIFRPIYFGHLIDEESFRPGKPFKFIIHGWTDYADKGWYEDIMNEYLDKEDVNIIGVDWKKPASELYPLSAKHTKDVGTYVGELLVDLNESLGVKFSDMHVIGHSLGAHISGFAGKYVEHAKKAKIGRITGMDPAGPLFLLASKSSRLSSDDATFVDVIHTDAGKLGMTKTIGHADFYPNGGGAPQPGCMLYNSIIDAASCSHTRSYKLFRESVNSKGFVAKECASLLKYDKENVKITRWH